MQPIWYFIGVGLRTSGQPHCMRMRPLAPPAGGAFSAPRVDVDGNLWCGWGMSPALDGVKVFNPAGQPIGFIALPERAANVCFGGRKRNRLFMAASHSLYALYVNAQGTLAPCASQAGSTTASTGRQRREAPL